MLPGKAVLNGVMGPLFAWPEITSFHWHVFSPPKKLTYFTLLIGGDFGQMFV